MNPAEPCSEVVPLEVAGERVAEALHALRELAQAEAGMPLSRLFAFAWSADILRKPFCGFDIALDGPDCTSGAGETIREAINNLKEQMNKEPAKLREAAQRLLNQAAAMEAAKQP